MQCSKDRSDLEQKVVGCAVYRGADYMSSIMHLVGSESFLTPYAKKTWNICIDVAACGEDVDLTSVAERIVKSGDANLLSYVSSSHGIGQISPNNAKKAAEKLKAAFDRHNFMLAAQNAVASLSDPNSDVVESVNNIKNAIDSFGVGQAGLSKSFDRACEEFEGMIEDLMRSDVKFIPTPWENLNFLVNGWFPEEQTVIAGRPSNGKTALAINIVTDAAQKGYGAGIISLEMGSNQLLARMAASHLGISGHKFRKGGFSGHEANAIKSWVAKVKSLNIPIFDGSEVTPSSIECELKRWAKYNDIKLAMVDYLQLIESDKRVASREQHIAEVSRSMKKTARTTGMHTILLSQLNRDVEKRGKDAKPQLSDLRESGSIEQDADNVMLIGPWNPATIHNPVNVDLLVAKARNDSTGTAALIFQRNKLRFADRSFQSEQE